MRNSRKEVSMDGVSISGSLAYNTFGRFWLTEPTLTSHWRGSVAWRWRHNGHGGVSNHQPHHCLLSRLFGCRSKKTSKLLVTGLCAGNSPGTGELPAQMASNAENVSIWWRHHGVQLSQSNFIASDWATILYNEFENYTFDVIATSCTN